MKVNRTRSIAKKAMRKKGATSNRPEERLVYQVIKTHLSSVVDIEMQKRVDFDDIHYAKLDVYFTTRTGQKFAIRVNGPPHDGQKESRHDRLQLYLLQERLITAIDFWWDKMPMLFLRNKKILDEVELKQAFIEIKLLLKKFDLYLKSFDRDLIDQTE